MEQLKDKKQDKILDVNVMKKVWLVPEVLILNGRRTFGGDSEGDELDGYEPIVAS